MSNIVVLNFAYDVPVKLYSLHLAFISLFILSPNFSVLFNFFFLKKKVQLLSDVPLIPKKEIGYVVLALKAFIVVGYLCVMMISGTRYLSKAKENNLNGIYHVESFFSKDKSLNQWHKFIITDRYATVFYNEKKYEDFNITIDTLQNNVILQSKKDSLKSGNLTYLSSAQNKMDFKGIFENDSISVQSSIKRKKEFELVKRSFNLISDYPYNK